MAEALTIKIAQAATSLGVSRNAAYAELKRTGMLAGVAAIRVGRRLLLPAKPFYEALGMDNGLVAEAAVTVSDVTTAPKGMT